MTLEEEADALGAVNVQQEPSQLSLEAEADALGAVNVQQDPSQLSLEDEADALGAVDVQQEREPTEEKTVEIPKATKIQLTLEEFAELSAKTEAARKEQYESQEMNRLRKEQEYGTKEAQVPYEKYTAKSAKAGITQGILPDSWVKALGGESKRLEEVVSPEGEVDLEELKKVYGVPEDFNQRAAARIAQRIGGDEKEVSADVKRVMESQGINPWFQAADALTMGVLSNAVSAIDQGKPSELWDGKNKVLRAELVPESDYVSSVVGETELRKLYEDGRKNNSLVNLPNTASLAGGTGLVTKDPGAMGDVAADLARSTANLGIGAWNLSKEYIFGGEPTNKMGVWVDASAYPSFEEFKAASNKAIHRGVVNLVSDQLRGATSHEGARSLGMLLQIAPIMKASTAAKVLTGLEAAPAALKGLSAADKALALAKYSGTGTKMAAASLDTAIFAAPAIVGAPAGKGSEAAVENLAFMAPFIAAPAFMPAMKAVLKGPGRLWAKRLPAVVEDIAPEIRAQHGIVDQPALDAIKAVGHSDEVAEGSMREMLDAAAPVRHQDIPDHLLTARNEATDALDNASAQLLHGVGNVEAVHNVEGLKRIKGYDKTLDDLQRTQFAVEVKKLGDTILLPEEQFIKAVRESDTMFASGAEVLAKDLKEYPIAETRKNLRIQLLKNHLEDPALANGWKADNLQALTRMGNYVKENQIIESLRKRATVATDKEAAILGNLEKLKGVDTQGDMHSSNIFKVLNEVGISAERQQNLKTALETFSGIKHSVSEEVVFKAFNDLPFTSPGRSKEVMDEISKFVNTKVASRKLRNEHVGDIMSIHLMNTEGALRAKPDYSHLLSGDKAVTKEASDVVHNLGDMVRGGKQAEPLVRAQVEAIGGIADAALKERVIKEVSLSIQTGSELSSSLVSDLDNLVVSMKGVSGVNNVRRIAGVVAVLKEDGRRANNLTRSITSVLSSPKVAFDDLTHLLGDISQVTRTLTSKSHIAMVNDNAIRLASKWNEGLAEVGMDLGEGAQVFHYLIADDVAKIRMQSHMLSTYGGVDIKSIITNKYKTYQTLGAEYLDALDGLWMQMPGRQGQKLDRNFVSGYLMTASNNFGMDGFFSANVAATIKAFDKYKKQGQPGIPNGWSFLDGVSAGQRIDNHSMVEVSNAMGVFNDHFMRVKTSSEEFQSSLKRGIEGDFSQFIENGVRYVDDIPGAVAGYHDADAMMILKGFNGTRGSAGFIGGFGEAEQAYWRESYGDMLHHMFVDNHPRNADEARSLASEFIEAAGGLEKVFAKDSGIGGIETALNHLENQWFIPLGHLPPEKWAQAFKTHELQEVIYYKGLAAANHLGEVNGRSIGAVFSPIKHRRLKLPNRTEEHHVDSIFNAGMCLEKDQLVSTYFHSSTTAQFRGVEEVTLGRAHDPFYQMVEGITRTMNLTATASSRANLRAKGAIMGELGFSGYQDYLTVMLNGLVTGDVKELPLVTQAFQALYNISAGRGAVAFAAIKSAIVSGAVASLSTFKAMWKGAHQAGKMRALATSPLVWPMKYLSGMASWVYLVPMKHWIGDTTVGAARKLHILGKDARGAAVPQGLRQREMLQAINPTTAMIAEYAAQNTKTVVEAQGVSTFLQLRKAEAFAGKGLHLEAQKAALNLIAKPTEFMTRNFQEYSEYQQAFIASIEGGRHFDKLLAEARTGTDVNSLADVVGGFFADAARPMHLDLARSIVAASRSEEAKLAATYKFIMAYREQAGGRFGRFGSSVHANNLGKYAPGLVKYASAKQQFTSRIFRSSAHLENAFKQTFGKEAGAIPKQAQLLSLYIPLAYGSMAVATGTIAYGLTDKVRRAMGAMYNKDDVNMLEREHPLLKRFAVGAMPSAVIGDPSGILDNAMGTPWDMAANVMGSGGKGVFDVHAGVEWANTIRQVANAGSAVGGFDFNLWDDDIQTVNMLEAKAQGAKAKEAKDVPEFLRQEMKENAARQQRASEAPSRLADALKNTSFLYWIEGIVSNPITLAHMMNTLGTDILTEHAKQLVESGTAVMPIKMTLEQLGLGKWYTLGDNQLLPHWDGILSSLVDMGYMKMEDAVAMKKHLDEEKKEMPPQFRDTEFRRLSGVELRVNERTRMEELPKKKK